ncbi:putative polyketide synthase [Xylaria venustula]|nr:putative polyketide synthase [Xylaria venustula]
MGDISYFEGQDGPKFEPIAIVGMAMRLPGRVRNGEDFWRLLSEKKSGLCEVPKNRFNVDGFYDGSGRHGTIPSRKGYFLEDVDVQEFDPSVFPISKKELERLDPSQRQLLQVAYECFESAGVTSWRGSKFGCYIGCFGEDWQDLNAKETQHSGGYRGTGYGDFSLANRISYEFDLHGPSMTVKTACSSSLVALNLACAAIHRGECDGALVGGASLIFSPTMWLALHDHGVLSSTGECRTFDASTDGYARGEALNMVFLKKAVDAIRDNDPIRAIIRGTGVNTDGKTQGMLTPSASAQAALIKSTYALAGISDMSKTAIVEMHGTGTPVGDPLEAEAVAECFGDKGVIITSVKPNIGHSEAAAGLSSLIKCVLALEHRLILPNINFKTPNPKIPFEKSRLHVPVEVESWPEGRDERVSVNCFGIGGANAHVILESPSQFGIGHSSLINGTTLKPGPHRLLTFSAYSSSALQAQITSLQEHTKTNQVSIADLAYTLSNRREQRPHRAYAITDGKSPWQLSPSDVIAKPPPRVCWIFTGQGAQWPRMGAELLDTNYIFRKSIRKLDRFLSRLPVPPQWTIEDELRKDDSISRVHQAEIGHPLLLALQIGLVDILKSWNILPDTVLGHSSGEIAAAYASGAISAETAISTGLFRSTSDKSPSLPGKMAAVGLGREEVLPFLIPGVVIACENSHCSVTLSGDAEEVEKAIQSININRPGTFTRFLRVERAFHSHHMLQHGQVYEENLQPFFPEVTADPRTPFYSSVAGSKLKGVNVLGPSYWRKNMENPVLFNSALRSLLRDEPNDIILIEIGPHPALGGPIRQILGDMLRSDVYFETLSRGKSCHQNMLHLSGKLFLQNFPMNYSLLCPPGKFVQNLPQYSWNRDVSYWAESRVANQWRFRQHPPHELLGSRIVEMGNEPSWRVLLRLEDVSWLSGHEVNSKVVFPAAGYIAMIGEALRQLHGETTYRVKEVRISSAILLDAESPVEIITSLKHSSRDASEKLPWYTFTVSSHDGTRWTTNCTGEARSSKAEISSPARSKLSQASLSRSVDSDVWYRNLHRIGFQYSGLFRGLQSITAATTANKAAAIVPIPDELDIRSMTASIHPSVLDRCFQLFTVAAYRGLGRNMDRVAVPSFIEEIIISASSSSLEVNADISTLEGGSFMGNLAAHSDGEPCLTVKGLKASVLTNDDRAENDRIISRIEWQRSSEFLDLSSHMHPERDSSTPKAWTLLEELIALCILDHQQNLKLAKTTPSHLNSFFNWMQKYTKRYMSGANRFLSCDLHLELLDGEARLARIEEIVAGVSNSQYSMLFTGIYRLFLAAPSIFEGKTHPLGVLLEDDILAQIYIAADALDFQSALRVISNTQPRLRILEVGAGTGGTTAKVLAALKSSFGERLYATYMYTDISSGFMNAAKARFSDYDRVEYAVLDITKDPAEQGFELGVYDLVVCANVLHATPSLQTSLRHVHDLLAPGGRILLEELCPDAKFFDYIYGFLPGWWLGANDGRVEQPYVDPQRWAEELVRAGFREPEAVAFDGQPPYHLSAGILASRNPPDEHPERVTLLSYTLEAPLLSETRKSLESCGVAVDTRAFGDPLPPHQPLISFLDLQDPVVHGFSDTSFETVVRYLRAHKAHICWVMPVSQAECEDPRAAMTLGLARTARNELSLQLFTLEVDEVTSNTVAAEAVTKILFKVVSSESSLDTLDPDYEYAIIRGEIFIPRFHWETVNESAARLRSGQTPISYMKRMDMGTQGLLRSISWVEEKVPSPVEGTVLVEMRAAGLNFRDVTIALNLLDNSTTEMGLEGSGVIKAVGPGVHNFSVGDRVMFMFTGSFTTHLVVPAALCVKMVDSMSFEQAAAIPCVYATVLYGLIDKANLSKGQSVLIHSACGGVGLAAIQLAQVIGAEIYCTVGNEAKIEYLIEHFGISRSRIFNSRDSSFLPAVMDATGGRGVDVVLNSLSGELLHASWQCVAEFGTMVEIGKRDFRRRAKLPMENFEQNRAFIGLDICLICKVQPRRVAELIERSVGLIQRGIIGGPIIADLYPAMEIQDAIRTMQSAQHIGKIIVSMPEDPQTLEARVSKPVTVLNGDRSYLLVGGLGGLGRAVATWMTENGARELIFLSRSAEKSPEAQHLLEDLRSQNCQAHLVAGDVTNAADVRRAVECGVRPLAGIINMAMVLKDMPLIDMTLSDWNAATKPKVVGTWNLHNAAPADLDFFVLFSSWSGISGQWSQANYAAANTFLDAFVRFRQRNSLAASVIDIGVIGDAGFVSDNIEIHQKFEKAGIRILREQHLLDALTLAIQDSPPRPHRQTESDAIQPSGQFILGMSTSNPISSPSTRTSWKRDARAAIYHNFDSTAEILNPGTANRKNLKSLLASEDTDDGRKKIIAEAIAEALAGVLIRDVSSISLDVPLETLGMDSLVAIELRNWIRQHTGADVSAFTITQSPSLFSLGDCVRQGMGELVTAI